MNDNIRILLKFQFCKNLSISPNTKCWYLLNFAETPSIKHVQKDIVKKFIILDHEKKLKWKHAELLVKKSLVPSWENARVLHDNDVVRYIKINCCISVTW